MKNFNIKLYSGNNAKRLFSQLKYYVYALSAVDNLGNCTPFYIGKGVGDRCLQHLEEQDTKKATRIKNTRETGKFTIEILRHGLDEKTAKIVEAACIDLLNVGDLTSVINIEVSYASKNAIEKIKELGGNIKIIKKN